MLAKDKVCNPRQYWSHLKKTAGLGRIRRSIPDEAMMDGLVVKGDLVLKVWQEAFRKLFTADPAFDRVFMYRIQGDLQEEAKGNLVDSIFAQLNAPIACKKC